MMGAKTPKRRKRDRETIACLPSDCSTHIHLRQDRKLLISSSTREKLRAYNTLLDNKAEGISEEKLDHHVVGATGGGVREDEVRDSGDEDAQEEEEGS
ncbi:hypothetical protein BHE74_00011838 [Ensete ventricosum]|nr:hypothetical protein BHE74_00011838 [Ensete ventricosum]